MDMYTSFINEKEKFIYSRNVYPYNINKITDNTPSVENSPYYKMDYLKKGTALIFNHEKYNDPKIPERNGSAKDCESLTTCLTEIGFTVTQFDNLTRENVSKKLSELARKNHSDSSCILIAVLTHGSNGCLRAYDGFYETRTLWAKFTADQCPSLAGKPKLFIIQACQGFKLDSGINVTSTIQTDGVESTTLLPLQPDFLVAYSTVPGYRSFRKNKTGSVFIQAVCDVLKEKWKYHDLLTILTYASHRVAINYESRNTRKPFLHQKKQIPSITSTLTKLLKF